MSDDSNNDVTAQSASRLAAHIAARRMSAREVVEAHLARVEELNPIVNAICTLNPEALRDAEEVDRRLASKELPRPLEGVPFVVKDVVQTKGVRTTFGSRLMEDHVPEEDAVSVERLLAAGGIMLGKTNTPEFAHDVNTANQLFGTTRNPWNLNVTAGGSSGGTAAAIAAAMAPIGLGTDLGGSVRIPSSFCGISGLRPSPGRIPVYPAEFAWDTLVEHVHGPMALRIEDLGLMLSVLAGPDDRDPSSMPHQDHDYIAAASHDATLKGRRVAFSCDLAATFPVDPEVARLIEVVAHRFEAFGCSVQEDSFDAADLREIITGTRAFGMIGRYADRVEAYRDLMTPPLVNQASDALKIDARTITRAERLRSLYWHRIRRFFERYDYLLLPTVGAPPFRLDEPLPTRIGGVEVARYYDIFLATYAFSVVGLPAISVPCGWTSSGLPVGLQIVGRRLREDLVLEAASAYAAAHGECFKHPRIDPSTARELGELATPGMTIR